MAILERSCSTVERFLEAAGEAARKSDMASATLLTRKAWDLTSRQMRAEEQVLSAIYRATGDSPNRLLNDHRLIEDLFRSTLNLLKAGERDEFIQVAQHLMVALKVHFLRDERALGPKQVARDPELGAAVSHLVERLNTAR